MLPLGDIKKIGANSKIACFAVVAESPVKMTTVTTIYY